MYLVSKTSHNIISQIEMSETNFATNWICLTYRLREVGSATCWKLRFKLAEMNLADFYIRTYMQKKYPLPGAKAVVLQPISALLDYI